MSEFDVSEFMVRKARKLKDSQGILGKPAARPGKQLSEETKLNVQNFFQDDEISRICPGMRDVVSIPGEVQKHHEQKRLLLGNLEELHVRYKEVNGNNDKVGFSKFCELRPKWCVTVSSSGSHTVCVCTIHQNVKLLLVSLSNIIGRQVEYPELISAITCEPQTRNCRLQRCDQCPGLVALRMLLDNETRLHLDDDDEISFKQWVHTDRTTIITRQVTKEEFLSEIVCGIEKLTAHDFIAKHQSNFLRELKASLPEGTAVILLDFSENYSFVIQDAVQGFYWDNSQATVHPFAIYFQLPGKGLQHRSVCCLSDCMKHETVTVYAFQIAVLKYLRELIPMLQKVIYFSDGAASQYKNYKNFTNLRFHKTDFELEAEWHFFATSHGKSPCDGIGGTVKRLSRRASLQRPVERQIMTTGDLFTWCSENIQNIKFFLVSKEEIDRLRPMLDQRFQGAHTIPGTRDHHCFIPTSERAIRVSRVSGDTTYFTARAGYIPGVDVEPGQYISCVYEEEWWLGVAMEKSEEFQDITVKFMHPAGPAPSFHWPARDDICHVPFTNVLRVIPAPTTNRRARQYRLSDEVAQAIMQAFANLN